MIEPNFPTLISHELSLALHQIDAVLSLTAE